MKNLELMVTKDIVLFAARATRATQAGNKKNSHANRHNDSECVSIRRKPLDQTVQMDGQHTINSKVRR
jgi:hypothetical protein